MAKPITAMSRLTPAYTPRNEEIIVIDNGKRKRMAKAEIEFRQLFTKAIKGDLTAARLILCTATKYFSPEAKGDVEYEFIGVTEAARRFGRNWPIRVAELNMSRGFPR